MAASSEDTTTEADREVGGDTPDLVNPVDPVHQVDTVAGQPDNTTDTPGEDDANEDDGPLSKQAAKFRKRCRELETELATAQATITGLQRQQAEQLAATEGVRPAALWAVTELDGLLGEDGGVDAARVRSAVEQAAQSLGVTRKRALDLPTEGRTTPPPGGDARAKWDAKFRPSYKR